MYQYFIKRFKDFLSDFYPSLEHTTSDGKTDSTKFYSLDAIVSLLILT